MFCVENSEDPESGSTLFSIKFISDFILLLKECAHTFILFKHSGLSYVFYALSVVGTSKTFFGQKSYGNLLSPGQVQLLLLSYFNTPDTVY